MKQKKNYKKLILILILINLFIFVHLFIGKNTIQNYFKYKKQLSLKQQLHNSLIKERYEMEKIISMLKSSNVDNDILDEFLRQNLQLSSPNETIILSKE